LGRSVALYAGDEWITLDILILISHWLAEAVGTGAPEGFDTILWSSITSNVGHSGLKFRPLQRIFNLREGNIDKQDNGVSFDAVSLFRGYGATDPRDNIYGLLGLLELNIEPDYSPCNSAAQVYESYTVSCNNRHNSLNIIHMAQLRQVVDLRVQDLPSWVPDWNKNVAPSYSWPEEDRPFNMTGITTWSIADHKLRCLAILITPIMSNSPIPGWHEAQSIVDLIESETDLENDEGLPLHRYMMSKVMRIFLEDGYILRGKRICGSDL
jgi:hypothetical protein